MNSNQPWLLGREGERIAAGFLEKKGYRIVQRNFRFHRNEIDIIAMDGETVCFIEVKTRSSATKGEPAEAVTPGKQREIARAAEAWLAFSSEGEPDCRFDVVGIIAEPLSGGRFRARSVELFTDAFHDPGRG
ncbi:YraN family protein [Chlorobium phaeovibrioides]|uniref:UPF0102 protein EKD02_05400 n=1 Tax=Chlorobium phaeovibrioides TaxID=1094 RepID=A0A3S0U1C7_CHLPH|nr:YraN family protein [Chlorobium phaeovibrioides]RTY36721.1 YraN family protein [Chlorobium phaeovibrioides]RTY38135.1 YraN family protein [Chlorobium phaeovibrioides]